MATKIFLGEPPARIKQWIIDHYCDNSIMRFAVASDLHIGSHGAKYNSSEDFEKLLTSLETKNVSELNVCGDIVDNSLTGEIMDYKTILSRHDAVQCYTVRGNHDAGISDGIWSDTAYIGRMPNFVRLDDNGKDAYVYMSFDYFKDGDVSYDKPYATGLQWLEQQLISLKDRRVFLFMHLPVNSHDPEWQYPGLEVDDYYGFSETSIQDTKLIDLMKAHGHVVCFSGHSHYSFNALKNEDMGTDYDDIYFKFRDYDVTLVHVPSLAIPRGKGQVTENKDNPSAQVAQAFVVTVADDKLFLEGIDVAGNSIKKVEGRKYDITEITDVTPTSGKLVVKYSNGTTKTLDVGNTITSSTISDKANVVEITIPDSVTSIGYEAFYGCYGLISITIPDSVTSIGYGAFYGCYNLTSITIPDSVTRIGENAFYNTPIYKNATDVLYIGNHLIKCKNTSITSYAIKPGTKTIADQAFWHCSSLTSITLPDSVTSIGSNAFSDTPIYKNATDVLYIGNHLIKCKDTTITAYDIKPGTKTIADYAFSMCTDLISITIPDSVTRISNNAFDSCTCLTSITLPDSITSIGNNAFYSCSNLTSITIPDSVTSIGTNAFQYCTCLTSITIPNSVTSIGGGAFSSCTNLTSITIPNSVTNIGTDAFYGCANLTSITIPDSVTSIGEYAFSSCSNLTDFEIKNSPNAMTCMPSMIFGCHSDNSVVRYMGNSLTHANDTGHEFCNFKKLEEIYLNSMTSEYVLQHAPYWGIPDEAQNVIVYCRDGYVVIHATEGVESSSDGFDERTTIIEYTDGTVIEKMIKGELSEYSIDDKYNVKTVIIGTMVTSIGNYAFQYCSSLTSVTIPDSVTSIGYNAFYGCANLTSVTIPDSVTSIGSYAFNGCRSLTSVTIPDSVTSIGESAFGHCTDLTSVTIPDSVTRIGAVAFWYCSSLTSVTIPDSVTSIGYNAFYGCANLTSITIPDSVTSIGESAFYGCSSTAKYYVKSSRVANLLTSNGSRITTTQIQYV